MMVMISNSYRLQVACTAIVTSIRRLIQYSQQLYTVKFIIVVIFVEMKNQIL